MGEALEKRQCVEKSCVNGPEGAGPLEPKLHVRWRFISPFIVFHFLLSLFEFMPSQIYHSNYILHSNPV